MGVINLFGDITIEVREDFDPKNATPRELSQMSLALIEKYPDNWHQRYPHMWEADCHSYLGFIDILLGARPKPYHWNTPSCWELQYPIQEILGLMMRALDYCLIT